MAGGVGVFGTERRSEGIYVLKSKRIGFHIQLPADGQIRGFSEKILAVIDTSVLIFGNVFKIHGSHLEHFAGALAVASRNQRRMHIDKSSLHKESMNRIGNQRTHPENGLKGIGPGTQMRNSPEIFKAVPLFLQRIIGSRRAFYKHLLRLDFKRLLCIRRRNQCSRHDNGGTYV